MSRLRIALFAVLLLIMGLGARCEAPELLPPDKNRPPDTFLTRGPEEEDVAYFRVPLYWRGSDTDGTVSQWQFAIDDTVKREDAAIVGTGWIRTTKTDSVFILRASPDGTGTTLGHRFFIASIDNEGKSDPTPAVLDFTAETFAYPIPEVVSGPAEGETLTVFSDVTLCWGGTDPDGQILKMQYRLDPIDLGYTTVPFGPGHSNCASYTSLPSNGSRESYRLLLIAEDDAGARNRTAVERRFVVNHDPNTTIARFYSIGLFDPPGQEGPYIDQAIVEGDTIADSSEVFFEWTADDVDGAISGAFWTVEGLGTGSLFSDPSLRDSAEARSATVRPLTSDVGQAKLLVGSVDEYSRSEGSPDTVTFHVNFPPSVLITEPAGNSAPAPGGALLVRWLGADRDGPVGSLEFDVELDAPEGGADLSTTVLAGLPAQWVFSPVGTGLHAIRIKPIDRRGQGKEGRTVEKLVVITSTSMDPQ